jgi:putative nucleotidyltransferase with HDIG domain
LIQTKELTLLSHKNDYAPLNLENLTFDLPTGWDLYIQEGDQYVLYKEAARPFTNDDRERLLSNGISDLWVPITSGDGTFSQPHLSSILALPDQAMPPLVKATLLYKIATSITKKTLDSSDSPEALTEAKNLVKSTVGYLAQSQSAFPALLSVMLHNFSIYTHSVNVAVYSVAVARFIGIEDQKDLRNLGLGAFLHDVGKVRVPGKILNKPGPLSPEEWAVMRQHPLWGIETLTKQAGLPSSVLDIVRQHHERLDGSGYPFGLNGQRLHQFSKIVAVADAFDAMTSLRPYRQILKPFGALSLIKKEVGTRFDPYLFTNLVLLLGNHGENDRR